MFRYSLHQKPCRSEHEQCASHSSISLRLLTKLIVSVSKMHLQKKTLKGTKYSEDVLLKSAKRIY